MSDDGRQKQMEQAEEILGDRLQQAGFAKGLYFGHCLNDRLPPYPEAAPDPQLDTLLNDLQKFCGEHIDADAIDRNSEIPPHVIEGLGKLGVLGACLPASCGGMDLSQTSYCRVLEILGAHCGSTALFVNAHHSIGPRALVLFGTEDQQNRYLPDSATGKAISSFALTEPEAGSDAANVQTQAVPDEDGSFILNGEKRWITNGGVADVLTVMARTPVPGSDETKITAFLVTPGMPGFEVLEKRMDKLGVRGTATGRLKFNNMRVPAENVLGSLGTGLRIALTVLDFGRTTFGASCTGAAKFCVERAVKHVNTRVQFDKKLAEFEMVKEKIAYMDAGAYAMEACTYQTAALIDSGAGDFMLETAMLKVFSTEVLWRILNDTFQLHGGLAYFTDQPFERMLRDARINTIGEGANDVLRAFTALVGMRDVGLELQGVVTAAKNPLLNLTQLGRFAGRKLGSLLGSPVIQLRSDALEEDSEQLATVIGSIGRSVERLLATYQLEIVDRQHQLGRISDVVTEAYVSVCVLKRLDAMLRESHIDDARRQRELLAGRYYLRTARRRMRMNMKAMWDNDDEATNQLANLVLDKSHTM